MEPFLHNKVRTQVVVIIKKIRIAYRYKAQIYEI